MPIQSVPTSIYIFTQAIPFYVDTIARKCLATAAKKRIHSNQIQMNYVGKNLIKMKR